MENVPDWFFHLATVLIGLVFGSFVNVLVARLPHGQSIVQPGSCCPNCKSRISWRDNFPILSFLLLAGKCRSCKKAISVRYPVIEALTALLFLAAEVHTGWGLVLFLRDWPILVILVAVTFIDLEHRIIPDVLNFTGLILGLLTCWMVPGLGWINAISGAAFGFLAFYLLAWTYFRLRGQSGLGGGDIKLLAMLGAFVGPQGVIVTMLVSSVFGSITGIGWALFVGKTNVMKVSLPFGPFLVFGALFYYLLGDVLWFPFMIPI